MLFPFLLGPLRFVLVLLGLERRQDRLPALDHLDGIDSGMTRAERELPGAFVGHSGIMGGLCLGHFMEPCWDQTLAHAESAAFDSRWA